MMCADKRVEEKGPIVDLINLILNVGIGALTMEMGCDYCIIKAGDGMELAVIEN